MELVPGTPLDGRYVVEHRVGQGGQGTVYRVRHVELDTVHALKVVVAPTADLQARVLQEGRAQASLRHPHIVRVTDVVALGPATGLVMDLVDGLDLGQVLECGRLTLEQADRIGEAILEAIVAAHRQGIVHRDLKPENVLLERADDGSGFVPKVVDFGLALHVGAAHRTTQSGALMGTPQYMSPEQIRDSKSVDERTDVWSLGAVLFELVTGHRAFDGDETFEIWRAVKLGERVPVASLVPGIPERMVRAIDGALKVDPEERLPTAAALLEAWRGEVARPTPGPTVHLDLPASAGRAGASSTRASALPTVPLVAGAAGLVVAIGAAAMGAAVLAGAVWWWLTTSRSAVARPPPEAVPEEPASPAPPVLAEAPRPAPTKAIVSGTPIEAPPPRPAPIVEAAPPPGPADPAPAGGVTRVVQRVGYVSASGARVRLKRDEQVLDIPDAVPVGEYEVEVDFADVPPFVYPRRLHVEEDARVRVTCNPGTQMCRYDRL